MSYHTWWARRNHGEDRRDGGWQSRAASQTSKISASVPRHQRLLTFLCWKYKFKTGQDKKYPSMLVYKIILSKLLNMLMTVWSLLLFDRGNTTYLVCERNCMITWQPIIGLCRNVGNTTKCNVNRGWSKTGCNNKLWRNCLLCFPLYFSSLFLLGYSQFCLGLFLQARGTKNRCSLPASGYSHGQAEEERHRA